MFRRHKPPDYATVGWVFNVRDGILRERKGKTIIRLDTFSFGFIFAFGMAQIPIVQNFM